MSEKTCPDYNRFGNTTGEVVVDTVDKRNNKMAIMIRRIFPSTFKRAQYIGLQMSGTLDGAINVSAPSVYNVRCGEKPVDGVSAITYAENGDIILFAPRGRIRIMARDIDLISEGNGTTTGFVNVHSNSSIDMRTGELKINANDRIGMAAETKINLNTGGEVKVSAGDFKVVEGPDVSPISGITGSGANTIIQFGEGLAKLIESLLK
tara:strand:+ start:1394 stop:2014 length:621 start_codon:yes stop_codon:yes gene_type:complete